MAGKYAESIRWKKMGSERFFVIELGRPTISHLTIIHNRSGSVSELLMICHHRKGSAIHRVDLKGITLARGLNDLMHGRFGILWKAGATLHEMTRGRNARIKPRAIREKADATAKAMRREKRDRLYEKRTGKKPLKLLTRSMADIDD